MLHISTNIKKIRKLRGKTQEQFAKEMGVTLHQQKTYEVGRSNPDLIYIEKLSDLTGHSTTDIKNRNIPADELVTKVTIKEKTTTTENHTAQRIGIENYYLPPGEKKYMLTDMVDMLKDQVEFLRRMMEVEMKKVESEVRNLQPNLNELRSGQLDIVSLIKAAIDTQAVVAGQVMNKHPDEVKYETGKAIDAHAAALKRLDKSSGKSNKK